MTIDPATASALKAGSSAVRVLSAFKARPGIRLGSREERREVYARFLSASVLVVGMAEHCRFQHARYPWFMSRRAVDKVEDMRNSVQTELMQAYLELLLAANPKPLAQAAEVMSAMELLMGCLGPRDGGRYDIALGLVTEAQRLMVEACRDDLWYQPRWWQLWRGAWWLAAWRQVRRPAPVPISRPGAGPASPSL
ncbi:hypothetical protein ACIOHE_15710 [Streptomyces sp. NPDC087851]|uniref:hypothetical protein n=1 Tax=Streptomyces sp. NPDC087851 TaxID=3365810 RepID=UPI0038135520